MGVVVTVRAQMEVHLFLVAAEVVLELHQRLTPEVRLPYPLRAGAEVAWLPAATPQAMAEQAVTPDGLQQPLVVVVLLVPHPQVATVQMATAPSAVKAVVAALVTLVAQGLRAVMEASPEARVEVGVAAPQQVVRAATVPLAA